MQPSTHNQTLRQILCGMWQRNSSGVFALRTIDGTTTALLLLPLVIGSLVTNVYMGVK